MRRLGSLRQSPCRSRNAYPRTRRRVLRCRRTVPRRRTYKIATETAMSDVKAAIDGGDPSALRETLTANPASANTLVVWGERDHLRTHPLHYVCDKAFDSTITYPIALALVEVLLQAG